jgi:hypothetical protein
MCVCVWIDPLFSCVASCECDELVDIVSERVERHQQTEKVFGKYWKNLLTLLLLSIFVRIFLFLNLRDLQILAATREVDAASSNDDCPWSSTSGEIYSIRFLVVVAIREREKLLVFYFYFPVFDDCRGGSQHWLNRSHVEKKIERLWNVIIKSHSSSLGKKAFCVYHDYRGSG